MPMFRTVLLAMAAVLTLAGCAGFVRDRIYRPSDIVSAPQWSERAPVEFRVCTSDGVDLVGLFWAPVAPNRDIIVYFHGNGGSLYRDALRAEALAAGGRGVIMTSYRGFSGHAGRASETGLRLDAAAYTDFARQQLASGGRLYLFGHSLGAAVALAEADRMAVDGVATLGAFTKLADAAPPVVRGMLPDRYDNSAMLRRVGPPVAIFHGTLDAIIPYRHAEQLAEAGGIRVRLFPLVGADHHPDMRRLGPYVWQALNEPMVAGPIR